MPDKLPELITDLILEHFVLTGKRNMGMAAAEFSWKHHNSIITSRETQLYCNAISQAAKCSIQKLRLHHLSKDRPANAELDLEGLAPLWIPGTEPNDLF